MWKEYKTATKNLALSEMGINDDKQARMYVNLLDVVAFYETESDSDEPMVNVVLKGGSEFGLFITYEDFKSDMIVYTVLDANS